MRGGRLALLVVLASLPALAKPPAAAGPPPVVVAIGASNTSGWGVGEAAAYPARLAALLADCGLAVRVVNAGIPFETTNGMRARIDADVPDGTGAVVIQPGGNDLRFLGSPERRAANLAAMAARLRERGIAAIVYDPVFPPEDYQWDRIHITAEGHGRMAQALLRPVAAAIAPGSRCATDGLRPDRGGSPSKSRRTGRQG